MDSALVLKEAGAHGQWTVQLSTMDYGLFFLLLRMRKQWLPLLLMLMAAQTYGQVANTATMDTLETTIIGQVGIGGYVDSYYGYNFNNPSGGTNPYFVSSARDNELTINLAYVDVRYRSRYMRARFVPGFGTYMDANYANEPGSLKNMVEASVGVLLSEKKKIWVDAGVLGSPYTNESAISKDHLMYTRSLAPENVPYYITGVKLSMPVSSKLNAYLYLINGWQVIQDNNEGKSVGTQLEFRPNNTMLFNWDTYVGDERSSAHPNYRTRYFTDLYWIFQSGKRWSATSCVFGGIQEREGTSSGTWWQANFIGKYKFTEVLSLSGRLEYFHDPEGVIITPFTGVPGFRTVGYGACANFQLHKQALFRFEARQFTSKDNVYEDKNGFSSNNTFLLMASLTAWF
jgi:hypothetical protein